MAETSDFDYSTLNLKLLKMWLPAVGVKSADEFCRKNVVTLLCQFALDLGNTSFVEQDLVDLFGPELVEFSLFEKGFDPCFDNQPPFQLEKTILSRSLSEGLFFYNTELPDVDFMCVLKNIEFSKDDQEHGGLLFREDTPFVYAYVRNEETQQLWSDYVEGENTQEKLSRLSSKKLKLKLKANYKDAGNTVFCEYPKENLEEVTEASALTVTKRKSDILIADVLVDFAKKALTQPIGEPIELGSLGFPLKPNSDTYSVFNKLILSSDIVLSISCDGWPICANEWKSRERHWPDISVVEKITQGGFHIVPKSSSDGDFRLSFSNAETMLMETLSKVQHKLMIAFKAVVKYDQATWTPNQQEFLSSYHLKTIAFWHIEKTSPEYWHEETLVYHLFDLLEELEDALTQENLPMYFMPKVNLFTCDDKPEMVSEIREKISYVRRNASEISEAVDEMRNAEKVFRSLLEDFSFADLCRRFCERHLRDAEEAKEILSKIGNLITGLFSD